jgi:hypothetical protein
MPPQPATVAPWTTLRPGPWIISAKDKKILENYRKKDYHKYIPSFPQQKKPLQ